MLGVLRPGKFPFDNFVPCRVEKITNSKLVKSLSEEIKKLKCIDSCRAYPPELSAVLMLLAIDANIWRAFPRVMISGLMRGQSAFNVSLETLYVSARVNERIWRNKSPGGCFSSQSLKYLALSRVGAIATPLVLRNSPMHFSRGLKDQWLSSPQITCENFLLDLARVRYSSDFNERLVQVFLLCICFLLVHPFSDANGRVARAALNSVASFGLDGIFPFSVFLLLQNGTLLYNKIMSEVVRGNFCEFGNYFVSCLKRVGACCERYRACGLDKSECDRAIRAIINTYKGRIVSSEDLQLSNVLIGVADRIIPIIYRVEQSYGVNGDAC